MLNSTAADLAKYAATLAADAEAAEQIAARHSDIESVSGTAAALARDLRARHAAVIYFLNKGAAA